MSFAGICASCSLRRSVAAWVLLPDLSRPSMTMKAPRFGIVVVVVYAVVVVAVVFKVVAAASEVVVGVGVGAEGWMGEKVRVENA